MRVLVVADDFTGACDTGVQFARPGRPCTVVFSPPDRPQNDVVVVDTESRHLSADDAALRVTNAMGTTAGIGTRDIVFKKIDSTFRGNVGTEVSAALDACPGRIALAIPAFPAGGRTTVGGRCLVHGVPLDQTEFARDPLSPVRSSNVAVLIGGARRNRLAAGPDALRRAVDESTPGDVIIVDARTQKDIERALVAVAADLSRFVLVGSAGLGAAVGSALLGGPDGPAGRAGPRLDPPGDASRGAPVLGVVGSLSDRSRAQVEFLVAHQDADAFVYDLDRPARIVDDAIGSLRSGRSVVMVSARERVPAAAASISEGLANVAASVIIASTIGGLVLTGGETALAVIRALGVDRVLVVRELAPGVPVLRLSSRSLDLPAVSKAGGFGEDDVLSRAFGCLREGTCLQ